MQSKLNSGTSYDVTISTEGGGAGAAGNVAITIGTSANGQTAGTVTLSGGVQTGGVGGNLIFETSQSNGGAAAEIAALTAGTAAGLRVGGSSCGVLRKLIYGVVSMDGSSGIASSAELVGTSGSVSAISAGDPVMVTPPSTVAGVNLVWSAYTIDDYVKITATNVHATTAYTGNTNWNYVVFVMDTNAATCA